MERGSRDPPLNIPPLLPTGGCNFSYWRQVLGEGPEDMGGEENGCEVQSFLPQADLPGLLLGYWVTDVQGHNPAAIYWTEVSLTNSLVSLGELNICLSE